VGLAFVLCGYGVRAWLARPRAVSPEHA
ncbi:MAG: hypothetical protein QOK22_382, partial [Gaiellaceae bacterium]|nr:hypothetical protein [Gaiellaceae bacterium]